MIWNYYPNTGNYSDYVRLPYSSGSNSLYAHANTGYYHIHASANLYPERAASVTLTKAAGAWAAYPTPTEIIPANTITKAFDIHWAIISEISANGEYSLRLYTGSAGEEVYWCSIGFTRNAVFSQEGNLPVQGPQILANTRISAAISSSNATADTCKIKLYYHTYG